MADLVDSTTNTIANVPQDEIQSGLTSGKYNLVAGQDVNVIDIETGELVALPSEQIPEAIQSNFYRIPSSQDITKYQNEQKYGTPLEQIKTGAEAAASGATFGLSRQLEKGLLKNEEEQRLRQETNPELSMGAEFTGALGSMILAPPAAGVKAAAEAVNIARATNDAVKIAQAVKNLEAAKATLTAADLINPVSAVNKIGQQVAIAATPLTPEAAGVTAKILAGIGKTGAKTLGSAVEGSVYGAGNAVSEDALGDADLNAENILHNMGYGALYGGAIGATFGLAGETYALGKSALKKDIQQAAAKDSIIESASQVEATLPTSLEEIAARNKMGAIEGLEVDLPQKARLLETNNILAGDSKFPAHGLQVQSLENPYNRKFYKTFLESGEEQAKDLAQYEALQKQEGIRLAKKYIEEISPEIPITSDVVSAGKRAVRDFESIYKANKDESAPFWEKFNKAAESEVRKPNEILTKLHESFPDTAKYVSLDPEGYFIIPRKAHMPFTPAGYQALKDTIEVLNEPHMKISNLRDLRKSIRNRVDVTKQGEARELSNISKSLMDIMENRVNAIEPDLAVREEFKNYAINEQNRAFLERDVFRGKLGDKTALGKGISHEDVLPRFFADSDTVRAAKQVIGDESFNEITANYLSHLMEKATDPTKGFSSNKFARSITTKLPEIQEALSQHPEQFAKLQAVVDKMRILPDSPSVNPSGTAAATKILEKIQKYGSYLTPGGIKRGIFDAITGSIERAKSRSHIDDILSGKKNLSSEVQLESKQKQYGAYTKIERMAQKLTNSIDRGVNKILEIGEKAIGPTAKELIPEDMEKKHEKLTKKLLDLTSSTELHIESLNAATKELNDIAPKLASSIQMVATRATNFLARKVPIQPTSSPFSPPYKTSQTEMAKFNRYVVTVENPLSALEQIKNGTLTQENIEALTVVHPKIYNEMKMSIMNKIHNLEGVEIPYQTRLMLSMFMGVDMDNSLKAANILAAQAAMNPQPPPPKNTGAITPTASSLGKINQANQSLTDTQKVIQQS